MNYRHAFHAGNFADVFKHGILAWILTYFNQKNSPYRLIDTHAGIGIYNLLGEAAVRTGEWEGGIGRLWQKPVAPELAGFLAPYLKTVEALNAQEDLRLYPGSPEIARRLSRSQDRLALSELHPEDYAALRHAMGRDPRVTTLALDGWTTLKAQVPPVERRGIVLIDPPFEKPGEFQRIVDGLRGAYAKWPTGTYLIWYPAKNPADIDHFAKALKQLALPATLRLELWVREGGNQPGLAGNGLIAVNPPWTLARELEAVLPALTERLSQGEGADGKIEWLVPQS